ncbi:tetratricopeptide repeat protein [Shewanella glacialimarina]|uniref:tetratricopeptide repeat protein n=1 Tax=Shewanella glacialimarina TaxID=2590884 RepID=UPI001CF87B42|nr:tetratricopeptide repeat protein [Shewanella glacialimarina]UCX05270.1 tetratricopeptide repeat protein [Shewanella glacialimarina]
MRHIITWCSLVFIILSASSNAKDLELQEITFRETPQELYLELKSSTQFPLEFSNKSEFDLIAKKLGMSPDDLIQQLILLARLNLESNVNSDTKSDDAITLIKQLRIVATTPLDKAVITMLDGRLNARKNQDYTYAISQYNDALNKISSDLSLQATLFRFSIHEHLSGLYRMALQPSPNLTHLNRYREIAYQLRNDYFIALAELELGRYYNRRNEPAKSLQYYTEAFRVGNRINYPGIKAHAQLNLARTYRDLEQWDEALKHAHDATTSFQTFDQGSYTAEALTVIAMIYAGKKEWNKAIDYYLNAQQVNERLGNEIGQGLNSHNIAEAYLNLNNGPAALAAIAKANSIFIAKNVTHYLVYNEALYTEILIKQAMWLEAIEHAKKSLILATEKNLTDQKLEALKYLSMSYRKVGDLNAAIEIVDQIIELSDGINAVEQDDSESSGLTEQKLKFDLSLLQTKVNEQKTALNDNKLMTILLLCSAIIIVIVLLVTISRSQKIIRAQRDYKQQYLLEPISQLNGFRACILRLQNDKLSETSTFALLKIEALTHSDTQMGLTESAKIIQSFINELSQLLTADIYVIKPGQFACYFNHAINAHDLLSTIEGYVAKTTLFNPVIPSFNREKKLSRIYIGHINMPLLANPDISISAELHFETAQYAIAAAMTQTDNTYVSIKTLNFAPATIFSAPLYLNLTQALKRGIIKVDSNQIIAEESWPR